MMSYGISSEKLCKQLRGAIRQLWELIQSWFCNSSSMVLVFLFVCLFLVRLHSHSPILLFGGGEGVGSNYLLLCNKPSKNVAA